MAMLHSTIGDICACMNVCRSVVPSLFVGAIAPAFETGPAIGEVKEEDSDTGGNMMFQEMGSNKKIITMTGKIDKIVPCQNRMTILNGVKGSLPTKRIPGWEHSSSELKVLHKVS